MPRGRPRKAGNGIPAILTEQLAEPANEPITAKTRVKIRNVGKKPYNFGYGIIQPCDTGFSSFGEAVMQWAIAEIIHE